MVGQDADGNNLMRYASTYHVPVLWKAVVTHLVTNRAGRYVDATLGGGGHAIALLDALEARGQVVGIDRDAEALRVAQARLAGQPGGRFMALQGNFGELAALLEIHGLAPVDGLLLDLGVSSHQIDTPGRGFSFDADGPLDMRMNPQGPLDAATVVNQWTEAELANMLRSFGEEPRAPKLARRIVEARPLETTGALANVIRRTVPYREVGKTLARVFQAVRIVVNDELGALERALTDALKVLKPGGRIAVIAYHSLEDRRVKRFLRYGNLTGEPVRDFYGNLQTPWHLVTRKPITADADEVRLNPRARSARLRVAEKA